MEHNKDLSRFAQGHARQQALEELDILDTEAEPEFDAITQAAAQMLGCEVSLVSLLDHDRQWFKSRHNISIAETPIAWSFCRVATEIDAPLVVRDASRDPRFQNNPLVTQGSSPIRFYAGVPIKLKRNSEGDSVALGALCVINPEPLNPSPEALDALERLARLTELLLEARVNARKVERQAAQLSKAMAEAKRMHRHLHQGERMGGFGSWRLSLIDNVVEWSPQVFAIHELEEADGIPAGDALDFYPPEDREILSDAISRCIQTGESYDLELDFITAKGRHRRVHAIGELELLNGRPEALIGVFQDVTERFELETMLRNAADTDDLTRIASRRGFNSAIKLLMRESASKQSDLALILIDLDHFKQVNDGFGHAAGDRVLREVALRLRSPWLKQSFAARLGGDEFVLVLQDPGLIANLDKTIARLARELRLDLVFDADNAEQEGLRHCITASIGAACMDLADPALKTLLKDADKSLYKAKGYGRGNAFKGNRLITGEALWSNQAPASALG